MTTTGKKADLWARIRGEVEGGSEACPISNAAKARAIQKQARGRRERFSGDEGGRRWVLCT
jgi:hypothetical protein